MKCEKAEKRFSIVLIGVFLILLPCMGHTAIPQKINYQGYLTNAAGVPVNGTLQIVFSIYDVPTGGSPLWTETQTVSVSHGVYSVNLGEVTPIGLTFNIPYYLGVQMWADSEMTPRKVLTSVGYAFRALTVESVGSHPHSGADITSGIISEVRIDPLIAWDSEVTAAVNAHASRTDNPHATTAAQVGAAPVVHDHDATYVNEGQAGSITSGMISVPLSLSGSVASAGILSGINSDTVGYGIYGSASNTGAGQNYGGYFTAAGSSGRGVYGSASRSAASTNYGGYFEASGTMGRGVYGYASGSSGYGVYGQAPLYGGYFDASGGMSSAGLYGRASNTGAITNYGGFFTANGTYGRGVYGGASNYGGYFVASGTSGIAVYGSASNTGAANYGGYFEAAGTDGVGVYGYGPEIGGNFLSDTNTFYGVGVQGRAIGTYGVGVRGQGQAYDFLATAGSGIDYGTESSIRWKTNIREIDQALDKVLNLRGVYFDWDEAHGGRHDMGFIAEEVGKVIPEIVAYEPDGVYATGIDYGAITPMLVQAIKEQQRQIEELKAQIEELRKKLD